MATTDYTARLARAAQYLDATQISPRRWAHYDDAERAWYVVSASDLANLCDYLDSDDKEIRGSAYSHWCAGTSARKMTAREAAAADLV